MRSALRRLGREVTRDWTSALRELVLVIVGVLIALAGQSWWEGRSERQRETAYLRQLLVDIRETEIHLGHAIAGDSASLEKVTRFLGAADTLLRFGSALPTDSLSPLAETAYSSFVPLSGTYTALVQSDNLRLLRSDSLRFHIIAYAATMDAVREALRQTETQTWRNSEQVNLGWWAVALRTADDQGRADPAALLRDPQILNAMTMQRQVGQNRLQSLRSLQEPTTRLRRLLEAELRVDRAAPAHRH